LRSCRICPYHAYMSCSPHGSPAVQSRNTRRSVLRQLWHSRAVIIAELQPTPDMSPQIAVGNFERIHQGTTYCRSIHGYYSRRYSTSRLGESFIRTVDQIIPATRSCTSEHISDLSIVSSLRSWQTITQEHWRGIARWTARDMSTITRFFGPFHSLFLRLILARGSLLQASLRPRTRLGRD
jgi:hypothetical protein